MKFIFNHKSLFGIIAIVLLVQCNAKKNIVDSNDIQEIEAYLKTSHPEDPKNNLLKSKVIALKNAAWVKGAKDAKPMASRPLIVEIPKIASKSELNAKDAEEFKTLIALTPEAHREKTVKLLNNLFNSDVSNKEVILLLQNNSDCNMVMHFQGKKFYNLAVPAHGQNSIVLTKDTYSLSSSLCDVRYSSTKDLAKNQMIILDNPSSKINEDQMKNLSLQNKKNSLPTKTSSPKKTTIKRKKA
jgi:hypothetical protein